MRILQDDPAMYSNNPKHQKARHQKVSRKYFEILELLCEQGRPKHQPALVGRLAQS